MRKIQLEINVTDDMDEVCEGLVQVCSATLTEAFPERLNEAMDHLGMKLAAFMRDSEPGETPLLEVIEGDGEEG